MIMGTKNSLLKVFITAFAALSLSSKNLYAQTTEKSLGINATSTEKDMEQRIKWTSQLPPAVRKAFKNSKYSSWYIQKMISHSRGEQTIYLFYLDNSSLLDGEHRESMARKKTLTVSDKGIIIQGDDSNQY